jgi:Protein of unknown function (DUF3565)
MEAVRGVSRDALHGWVAMSEQRIVGFRQDLDQDWIAELECGHTQHVRHAPPWQVRPWVMTPEGRAGRLGTTLPCRQCDELQPARGR